MLKLAIYGLTGAGKSTTCAMAAEAFRAQKMDTRVVKLAAPLYRLQTDIYALARQPITNDQQDQVLLRSLASHLRRISPTFLVEDFLRRVDAVHAEACDVVINDDLKDTEVDYPMLVEQGFRFVHVTCDDSVRSERLDARVDLSQAPETETTWRFDRIEADWTIDNTDEGLEGLRARVDELVRGWLA